MYFYLGSMCFVLLYDQYILFLYIMYELDLVVHLMYNLCIYYMLLLVFEMMYHYTASTKGKILWDQNVEGLTYA